MKWDAHPTLSYYYFEPIEWYPDESYEMRTSSDFGLCPIEYAKKVKSIHQLGAQQNYDLSQLQEKLNINRKQNDIPKDENDDFLNHSDRKIRSAYYISDNVQIFDEILKTPGLKYLGPVENFK